MSSKGFTIIKLREMQKYFKFHSNVSLQITTSAQCFHNNINREKEAERKMPVKW